MNKELEIIRKLQHCGVEEYRIALEKVEKILLEYEQIKNANPSEASKELDKIIEHLKIGWTEGKYLDLDICFNNIKATLLKSQEQEKVLNIIKKKNVDIWLLKSCLKVEQYNFSITKIDNCKVFNLTQEEFDILKRYCNEII